MEIVVLGDIHWFSLYTTPWRLLGKRFLGQSNLWLNRRKKFNRSLLAHVVDRVMAIEPDLILFSGDLTTTALPCEFERVRQILKPLTERFTCLMVPGNHDRYTFSAARQKAMEHYFGDWMPEQFPAITQLGEAWHLLALDSAVPRFYSSRGKLGDSQRQQAEALLKSLPANDGVIVLNHYSLGTPPKMMANRASHKLEDEGELLSLLAKFSGPMIYLHGHIHRPWYWLRHEKELRHIVDLNAGSPVMCSEQYPLGQGFWQISLTPSIKSRAATKLTHHLLKNTLPISWSENTSGKIAPNLPI